MKTFFSLILSLTLFCLSTDSFSQASEETKFKSVSNQTFIDTASGTTPKTQIGKIPGAWNSVSIQVSYRRLTGTSAGKFILWVSNTGVAYQKLDSLTIVNSSDPVGKIFKIGSNDYLFYKMIFTGSGTHTTEFSTQALHRRY